jgi:acetate kinase
MTAPARLLILNAGSSSLKFALYDAGGATLANMLRGQIAGIGREATFGVSSTVGPATPLPPAPSRKGRGNSSFRADEFARDEKIPLPLREGAGGGVREEPSSSFSTPDLSAVHDHKGAIAALIDWLDVTGHASALAGAGHRVVHGGGEFTTPVAIDAKTIERLASFERLAPHHQPHNVAAIRALAAHRPDLKQIACFDTGFHATMPAVATGLGLPRALEAEGMRRYGFHGLSYEYVMERLRADGRLPARLIVAHLGNGCSMCAIRDGRSIATTMGFSTLDGIAMATRSGAVDPGALIHLMRQGMDADAIEDLLYNKSGLLGVSGISADMKTLLASDDPAARDAIEFFCYRIVREIGSLAAALGGCAAIAFTGGIGENAAPIRARIAEGLAWLGLALDAEANAANAREISTKGSQMRAYVVPTDEERVIARHTAALLGLTAR